MHDIGHKDGPRPKCYFTHSILPAFVDHDNPSQKKKPFSTIQEYPFCHTVDIILPAAAKDVFISKLNDKGTTHYSKVYMKLSEILEGDFFNSYIKSGDILLLASGSSSTISLHSGLLRLELDKATYERTGLRGTPMPDGGRKHVKSRFLVELNLRLPSMVRGKPGFERLLWAAKNVLNERVAWLFYDLQGPNDGLGAISAFPPIVQEVVAKVVLVGEEVLVPRFPEEFEASDQETPAELLEWLSLAMMGSPRVQKADEVDAYLSRYRVPELVEGAESSSQKLVKMQWHGFLPAQFIQSIVIAAMKSLGKEDWFALRSRAFDGKTHTFLQHGRHTMSWEYER